MAYLWLLFKQNSMIGDKITNQRGFTLIEILVAVAVFVSMVSIASGLFSYNAKSQRANLVSQELLEQASYLSEYMSRSIRMAKKDTSGACTGSAKTNYAFSGNCLKFVNYKGNCQQFCLEGTRLKDESGNYLTSQSLQVTSFQVSLVGQTQNDDLQPKVTFSLGIVGSQGLPINIQTTLSQRNLDIRR